MWSKPVANLRSAAIAGAIALLFAGCGKQQGANARHLPNPEVVDQHGRSVHFYDDLIAGKKVVVQFMYTRCNGICPAATASLQELQTRFGDCLGKDLHFVSISLDPVRDDVAALAEYARIHGIGAGWSVVSGAPDDIDALRFALGGYDLDPAIDAERSNHSAMLVLGNDAKDRWTMVNGLSPVPAIARAIDRLRKG